MDHYYMLDRNIPMDNYNHHMVLHLFEHMYLHIELKKFINNNQENLPPLRQGEAEQKSIESHLGPAKPVLQRHLFATHIP